MVGSSLPLYQELHQPLHVAVIPRCNNLMTKTVGSLNFARISALLNMYDRQILRPARLSEHLQEVD